MSDGSCGLSTKRDHLEYDSAVRGNQKCSSLEGGKCQHVRNVKTHSISTPMTLKRAMWSRVKSAGPSLKSSPPSHCSSRKWKMKAMMMKTTNFVMRKRNNA